MKLAVMQPYFFPYIGYFQLMAAVDRLVILDDVNFIKQGWINRNQILVGCRPFMFSIPLQHPSSFGLICDTRLALVDQSRQKLLKTIEQAYRKAPYFEPIYNLIKRVCERENEFIGKLALESIFAVANYIGIDTEIIPTSRNYRNDNLKGSARVLDICRHEGATEYYNLPGGVELYDRATFANAGTNLHFVQPKQVDYRQFDCSFVPWLSMIDVMMFNDRDTIRTMLNHYELA
jgi:hypothetical protein